MFTRKTGREKLINKEHFKSIDLKTTSTFMHMTKIRVRKVFITERITVTVYYRK